MIRRLQEDPLTIFQAEQDKLAAQMKTQAGMVEYIRKIANNTEPDTNARRHFCPAFLEDGRYVGFE